MTAIVLTLNEESHITDCLASLAWADRRLVFDSHSTDKTAYLARAAGAEVAFETFQNYAQQRNAALMAAGDEGWVFFVDADERCTPQLATEIRHVIAGRAEKGWYVPRHNIIFGRLTRGAGWFPDYQLRLFAAGFVRYERPVHEIAVVTGQVGYLLSPLVHYNYRDAAHFRQKQRGYALADARRLLAEGVRPRWHTPLTMPLRHFWWRFVSLQGYRDGRHGLVLSLYLAYYEWVKYRHLGAFLRETVVESSAP